LPDGISLAKAYFMIPLQLFVQRRIVSLPKTASAHRAAKAMCESSVGCILVTDEQNHLEGIVTDRDLACIGMGMTVRSDKIPLSDIMTPHPLSVEQTDDLEHVVYLMEESGIRRIPVVERLPDQNLRCIGLITLDDLVASKQINYDHIARIVRSQIERRNVLRRHPSIKRSKHAPGPDQRVTLFTLKEDISTRYGLSSKEVLSLLDNFFHALADTLPHEEVQQLQVELPEEFRDFLPGQIQVKNPKHEAA
jgi:CBS domain-containing protein